MSSFEQIYEVPIEVFNKQFYQRPRATGINSSVDMGDPFEAGDDVFLEGVVRHLLLPNFTCLLDEKGTTSWCFDRTRVLEYAVEEMIQDSYLHTGAKVHIRGYAIPGEEGGVPAVDARMVLTQPPCGSRGEMRLYTPNRILKSCF